DPFDRHRGRRCLAPSRAPEYPWAAPGSGRGALRENPVIAVRVVVFLLGAAMVVATFGSAIRTVVLPRGVPATLGRVVFRGLRVVFELRARPSHSYSRRDRVMAMYAPVGLLALLATWMALTLAGYAGM